MKHLLIVLIVFSSLALVAQTQSGKPLRYVFQKTTPSEIPYGNNPKAGRYANAGDAKIYYEIYGKGEPIVLLHGGVFGATIEMAQLIDSLSMTNQVIAISTRGHGNSEIGTEPMTYEQRANDVYAVVRDATKEKIMLLGFSDGAFAGFKYAGMYPQTIKKFIAVGATELYPGMRKFQFSKEMAFEADREYFEQQLSLMPEPNRWEGFGTGLMKFYSGLTVDKSVFEKIQCPVLLISGDRDDGCPVQNVINTYKMIPNCKLGIVPNGPHTVIQTNFDVVWVMVEPFIRSN
jgi:pimeloyl-ACP methyl ester carboxylesterase